MTCFGTYLNGTMNPEIERRKELERRKKLRLIQVRQQSKEFADKLRERIRLEVIQQKKKYVESEKKLKEEKHLRELHQLKEFYDRCLQSIGEGHKEAVKQPDLNLEKQAELARITDQANKRGAIALKKRLEEEAHKKEKIEAPVKQKKATRNKENLRAFFISSLPKKHDEHSNPNPVSPQKSTKRTTERQKTQKVLEEIPNNLAHCESQGSDLQNYKSVDKPNTVGKHTKVDKVHQSHKFSDNILTAKRQEDCSSNVSSPKECSCDYVVCSCHKSPIELRRCSSESRISSEKAYDIEEPKKRKVRSRSCSPCSVRTLNYLDCGNVYESNQQSCVRVTHHSRSPKRKNEPLPETVQESVVSKPSVEELKKRTDERSAKALRKEQLVREFQQLVQNLKKITQEKSVINNKTKGKVRIFSSERDILKRNEIKQKKLNNAFEKLPHKVKSNNKQNSGIQKPNLSDDSSPPTLNLALCQTNSSPVTRRVVSTEEVTFSDMPPARDSRRSRPMSSRGRSESPNVLVDRDPSGDVHITVKVSEVLGQRSKPPVSPDSASSYMSPPANLTPSQQQLLDALLCQVNRRAIGTEMKKYIQMLLGMSRESIDDLRGDGSKSPRSADIDRDLVRLGELAEIYAEKVKTLVDMYEQISSPSISGSPDTGFYVDDPIRNIPGKTTSPSGPKPTSARTTPSPRPRTPVNVSAPTPGSSRGPSPARSTGYGRTPQPRYVPRSPCTPSPYTPPPGSQGSNIPRPLTTQSTPSPQPYTRTSTPLRRPPQPMVNYPIKKRAPRVGSQPTRPHPFDQPPWRGWPTHDPEKLQADHHIRLMEQHARPNLGFSRITPLPIPCSPFTGASDPMTPPPGYDRSRIPVRTDYQSPRSPQTTMTPSPKPRRLETIRESPENTFASTSSGSTLGMLFGGIPGVEAPTREQIQQMRVDAAAQPPSGPADETWDMDAEFERRRQMILQAGEPPGSPGRGGGTGGSPQRGGQPIEGYGVRQDCIPGGGFVGSPGGFGGSPGGGFGGSPGGGFGGSPGGGFGGSPGGGFEGFGTGQEDWGDMGFGNEDFNTGMEVILQEEARCEDYVDYPEDFPPQIDIFGPGFDWETANLDQPSFPRSFPGEPLGGHSMSTVDGSVQLDTSFDTSALQGPVNPDRLNALRQKLSTILSDQYREIIEMLQKDASQHQIKFSNLLQKATSDPMLDPNATLAPVGSPQSSYGSPQHVSPLPTSRSPSPGFSATGRTPPGDRRISKSPDLGSCPCPTSSAGPSNYKTDFDFDLEYADFPDSNMDNLMMLVRNQKAKKPC